MEEIDMKPSIFKSLGLILLLGIAGCANNNKVIAYQETDGRDIQQQMQTALNEWQQKHDYDAAVMRLERLSNYSGGGFEQTRLTILALIQLESGNRKAFIATTERLGSIINSYSYLNPQTRHVLTVAYAMQGKDSEKLPGRGYDSNRVQTIYRLLGAS